MSRPDPGQWFAVVIACVSILTGSALAAKTATETAPKPGLWQGQTEEKRYVDFDVEKSGSRLKVAHFYASSKFKCSDGTTRYGSFYDLSGRIKKGEFSIDRSNPPGIPDWEQHVRGRFESKKRAKGTVRGSLTDLIDHSIHCEGKKVHWSAKLG